MAILQEEAVRPCLIWSSSVRAQVILSQGAGSSKKSENTQATLAVSHSQKRYRKSSETTHGEPEPERALLGVGAQGWPLATSCSQDWVEGYVRDPVWRLFAERRSRIERVRRALASVLPLLQS